LYVDTDSPTVPPDPVILRDEEPPAGGDEEPLAGGDEEPPAGGDAQPPSISNADSANTSPEHQPADSWEEAAVDGDPLLTPENEEVYESGLYIAQHMLGVHI
jgi:hypothetical protein